MATKSVSFKSCPKKVNGTKSKKPTFRRNKSLLGPLPVCSFGPKAVTSSDYLHDYVFDPENHKLTWSRPPESVLIVKRTGTETDDAFKSMATWLVTEKKLNVHVEEKLLSHHTMKDDLSFKSIFSQLKLFQNNDTLSFKTNSIDLIITLGGDGTLLYAASLFQHSMPPIIAFNMGSLGFLTAHPITNYKSTVDTVLTGNSMLMLRSRLRCKVQRHSGVIEARQVNGAFGESGAKAKTSSSDSDEDESKSSFLVLNEIVVNRGTSQYLCNIDLFLEGRQITSVQGDGLILSTPTGSTAYAVAAGASMVHPDVPSIVIAPICPHSLSFRPIVVPSGVELKFQVSSNARGPAWVSFDGSFATELKKGDQVSIRTSVHPAPCVCKNNPFDDWFDSLSTCLHWNSRDTQKALESGDA